MQLGFVFLLSFFVTSKASADLVIIANKSVAIANVSSTEIASVFLGKVNTLGGVVVTPVEVDKKSMSRKTYVEELLKKDETSLSRYWARMLFTGQASPPKKVGLDAEIVLQVASNRDLVAAIDSSALDSSVQVIYKVIATR